MYKATSEATHFLPRTGRHSTKGSRNGRVDVLPPNAQEVITGNFRERRDALIEQLKAADAEHVKSKEIMARHKIDFDNFSRRAQRSPVRLQMPPLLENLRQRFKKTRARVAELQNDLKNLNEVCQPARTEYQRTFAEIFVRLAEQTLDADVFARLRSESARRLKLSEDRNFPSDAGEKHVD